MAALLIAAGGGTAFTAAMLWFFEIPISDIGRLAVFPDEWLISELVYNSVAGLMWLGSMWAIHKAIREQWRKPPPADGPREPELP